MRCDHRGKPSRKRLDPDGTSLGTQRTTRNAPSMVNAVYFRMGHLGWLARSALKQGTNSLESKNNFNSDRLDQDSTTRTSCRPCRSTTTATPTCSDGPNIWNGAGELSDDKDAAPGSSPGSCRQGSMRG
jgi:hypothetical protein